MDKISQHINIILLCLNATGLSAFCHHYIHEQLPLALLPPFLLAFLPINRYYYLLRSIYCLLAALALTAVFIPEQPVAAILMSVSLGLALSVGYHQTNRMLLSHG